MTMLTHQPFRDWLFEENLEPQEALLLQEHLRTCEECQRLRLAWNDAQHVIQNAGQVSPAAGFVNRWQGRLAAQRLQKQRKLAWAFFFAAASLAALMLAVLSWQLIEVLSTPQTLLLMVFLRVAEVINLLSAVGSYLNIIRLLVPGLSLVSLIFFIGFISMISVLWLATYRKLLTVRRIAE
jgi:hypothetical protein